MQQQKTQAKTQKQMAADKALTKEVQEYIEEIYGKVFIFRVGLSLHISHGGLQHQAGVKVDRPP